MRQPAFFVVSAAFALFTVAGTASAQDGPAKPAGGDATAAAPTPAPVAAPTSAEKPKQQEDEDEFRPVALTANPLSLILGRIGINVEYLPVKHHGIILNPYAQFASAGDDNTIKTSYTNYGAELGYHFYTGSRGANGFFVGPSLIFMQSNAKTSSNGPAGKNEVSDSLTIYGGALDLGGQHVTKGGFTIGAGAGVMYLTASNTGTSNQTSSTVKISGVLPRFLFTVGYSF